jgi:hypothetical protein
VPMTIDPFWLVAAAAGGFFGAAIGALQSFVLCGFAVLLGAVGLFGSAGAGFLGFVAFGPVLGPHIAFAGGVAAAAFAHRRGLHSGKDIVTPLIGLRRPQVLLVGAGFGMLGYLIQSALAATPWLGTHTDTVALTVVVSAIITRFAFGRTGLIGRPTPPLTHADAPPVPAIEGRSAVAQSGDDILEGVVRVGGPSSGSAAWVARFAPTDDHHWVRYQENFGPNTVLGLFAGGLSAATALTVAQQFPSTGALAATVGFGISAASLLFLCLGMAVPVTHHMTLIGGVAALSFLPALGGSQVAAMLIGAMFGMVAAWVAEFFSRFWHIRGDTHIDPPASSIWLMTTVVVGLAAVL